MSLAKLTIQRERGAKGVFSTPIAALFNPTQLSYSRSLTWSPVHGVGMSRSPPGFALRYQSVAPETLTVELFFDTYAVDASGLLGLSPSAPPVPESVLEHTRAVSELASIDAGLGRPPICRLQWGKVSLFQGVLQQCSRTLTLFLEDGTPVRATMSCTFMESPPEDGSSSDEGASDRLPSTGMRIEYSIRPGDTLMSIAAALYGDGSQWRKIAVANRIDNPRNLQPGRKLSIPKIR